MRITLLRWYKPLHLTFRLATDDEVLFIFTRRDEPESEPKVELDRLGCPKEYESFFCEAIESLYWASLPVSLKHICREVNDNLPASMSPLNLGEE